MLLNLKKKDTIGSKLKLKDKMRKFKEFVTQFSAGDNFSTIRNDALQQLKTLDFPDRKNENWKYTRVNQLGNKNFVSDHSTVISDISLYKIPNLDAYHIVFINGKLSIDLSEIPQEKGIVISSISEKENQVKFNPDQNDTVFSIINQAFFTDGIYLNIQKNSKAKKTFHIINIAVGENISNQTRHFVKLENNAEAEIIISNHSIDAHERFNNTFLEIIMEKQSVLDLVKVQDDNLNTFSFSREYVDQKADSQFSIHTITTGGKLVRNDLEIISSEQQTHSELKGVFILGNNQHIDNHTVMDHTAAYATSDENYKGVALGQSTGVFNGKVFVREDAQNVNAFQNNANVLLHENASIYTKPELEIYADDVKCSHGSTTGQIDDEAVFYLRTRGISKQNAKKILVSAFINEISDEIKNPCIKNWVSELLTGKLSTFHDE